MTTDILTNIRETELVVKNKQRSTVTFFIITMKISVKYAIFMKGVQQV